MSESLEQQLDASARQKGRILAMSADMKAAMEWAKRKFAYEETQNLADAFREVCADLEKFRQAEIRWIDTLAAKDAELERERKAREETEKQLFESQCLAIPRDILERYESLIVCKDYSDLGKLGVRLLSMTHVMPYDIDGIVREHIRQRQEAEQRAAELQKYKTAWEEWRSLQTGNVQKLFDAAMSAADLQARLDRVEAAFNAACAFIDSHVGDPDITSEMVRTYAEFQRLRVLISTQNAAAQATATSYSDTGRIGELAPAVAHTDHPMRHWDRTCPACNSAAPDPVIEGLELAARIADKSAGAYYAAGWREVAAAIRAEIERRRNKS